MCVLIARLNALLCHVVIRCAAKNALIDARFVYVEDVLVSWNFYRNYNARFLRYILLQSCPVCRQSIEQILFVFLPIEREFVLSGKNRTDLPLPEASSTYTNNLSQDNTANSCNFQTVQVVT